MVNKKKYNALKLGLGKFNLRRFLSNSKRSAKVCNLEKAKTLGVTFVVTKREELAMVKSVLKQFADLGIQTYALGYIPEKKPDDYYLSQNAFNFFYDKELDFFLKPKSEAATEFIKHPFDVLIDLNTYSYFPMQQLLHHSKAGYKVGMFVDEENVPFDMMMNIEENKSVDYYIQQVKHYLSLIK